MHESGKSLQIYNDQQIIRYAFYYWCCANIVSGSGCPNEGSSIKEKRQVAFNHFYMSSWHCRDARDSHKGMKDMRERMKDKKLFFHFFSRVDRFFIWIAFIY